MHESRGDAAELVRRHHEHEADDDEHICQRHDDETRARIVPPGDGKHGCGDEEEDPAKAVLSKFAENDIIRAMESLPDGFREAVILSDLQGLSYEEIAQNLRVPLGTVRSRLNRGRRQLQKALWEEAVQSGYIHDKKMNPMKRWSSKLFKSLRGKRND